MVIQDDEISAWMKAAMKKYGIESARQAEPRAGVSYSTIQNLLNGRRVSPQTIITIATNFDEDIIEALRVVGHTKFADAYAKKLSQQKDGQSAANMLVREQGHIYGEANAISDDERELLLFYRGVPPADRTKAKRILQAMRADDDDADDLPTFGRGKGAR